MEGDVRLLLQHGAWLDDVHGGAVQQLRHYLGLSYRATTRSSMSIPD